MFNLQWPYLRIIDNSIDLTNVAETDFITRNIEPAFTSYSASCPQKCVSYDIEKITDYETGQTLSLGSTYGYQFSIDNAGIFKYQNYTTDHSFYLWVSCKGANGAYTGVRDKPNIMLE